LLVFCPKNFFPRFCISRNNIGFYLTNLQQWNLWRNKECIGYTYHDSLLFFSWRPRPCYTLSYKSLNSMFTIAHFLLVLGWPNLWYIRPVFYVLFVNSWPFYGTWTIILLIQMILEAYGCCICLYDILLVISMIYLLLSPWSGTQFPIIQPIIRLFHGKISAAEYVD
jgi:hypothetical protein